MRPLVRSGRLRVVVALVAVVAVVALVLAGGAASGWLATAPATRPAAAGPPRFVEETATAGLSQTYDGPVPYFTGGGVAVLDCDGDGMPDLFVAGGSNSAALFHNDSQRGGALRFSRIADPATDLAGVTGAYPIDIDGDGQPDLVVLRAGGNVLLRGLGGCRFQRANESLGIDGGNALTTAFSATWEPGLGLPTLAFGNYLGLDGHGGVTSDCSTNSLVRPLPAAGDSASPRYGPPIPLEPSYCALSALFSDWDRSGRRDLRLSNDRNYYTDGEDQLWKVAPGSAPQLYTADDGWVALQLFGMGIAGQDLTGDGLPEYYLTSQGDNRLQTLATGPAQPRYRDIALKRGVTSAQPFTGGQALPSTSWHPEFADVNNDGLMDLFVSKGNVKDQPGYATRDPSDLFLGQADGTFAEAADRAGTLDFDSGRGAALVDLNLDGLLDLVEVHLGAPVRIWRNTGVPGATPGHWLALRLTEPGPNVDAIGAWLEVTAGGQTTVRELAIGGGHAGGQLGWLHVGLGAADHARVRVQWPDGTWSQPHDLAADEWLTIDREADAVETWTPSR